MTQLQLARIAWLKALEGNSRDEFMKARRRYMAAVNVAERQISELEHARREGYWMSQGYAQEVEYAPY